MEEAKRVVWPTRKETLQTTGVVFLFVFVMALFLWVVDTGLLWVTQKLLGQRGLNMSMRWYVVHAYSGQEKSIQAALLETASAARAWRTSSARCWCRSRKWSR